MLGSQQISKKAVNYMISRHIIETEHRPYYEYGFEHIFEQLFFFLLILGVGFFTDTLLLCLTFLLTLSPLRTLAGGAHASSRLRCSLLSLGCFFLCWFLSLVLPVFHPLLWIILYAAGILAVAKSAPVCTPQKKLTEEQKLRLHRLCICFCLLLSFAYAFLIINSWKSYYKCITICVIIVLVSVCVAKKRGTNQ